MPSPYSLTIQYDRTEGERAVFVLPDGQQLFWPLALVPEHYKLKERYTIGFIAEASLTTPNPATPTNTHASQTRSITPSDTDRKLAIALLEELFQKEA